MGGVGGRGFSSADYSAHSLHVILVARVLPIVDVVTSTHVVVDVQQGKGDLDRERDWSHSYPQII